MPKSKVKHW